MAFSIIGPCQKGSKDEEHAQMGEESPDCTGGGGGDLLVFYLYKGRQHSDSDIRIDWAKQPGPILDHCGSTRWAQNRDDH